jgi:hypothetical protein
MARVVRSFAEPFTATDGVVYAVRVAGRRGPDGPWEGWIEFEPADGSLPLRTPRETTQPSAGALEYWAYGLTLVYLQGALDRAIDATLPKTVPVEVPETPAYDAPAPPPHVAGAPAAAGPGDDEPVLDPFSVHAMGEGLLRRRLGALGGRHLRAIVRAYALASELDIALDALDDAELIELIVAGTRRPRLGHPTRDNGRHPGRTP